MQGDRVRDVVLGIISTSQTPLETPEILERVLKQIKTTRTIVFRRLTDLREEGVIFGEQIGSGKGAWIWWNKELLAEETKTPVSDDKIAQKVLDTIFSSKTPLETKQIEEIVQNATPATRTIIFKRLMDLRGDYTIEGKQVGSGKGAWIWWKKTTSAQEKTPTQPVVSDDKVAKKIIETIKSSKTPLETTQIEDIVRDAIPATRTIIFKRLTDLRGDGVIEGKHIGSGKGTWIWWNKETQKETQTTPVSDDKVAQKVLDTIFTAHTPLETKQVEEIVRDAIPATRTIIFKRLTDLRGDNILRGRVVGSGKGTWIWWRENATR